MKVITDPELKKTPLAAAHRRLNAKMVPFGGWEMPLQYEGILVEHEQTRRAVSVFDISHMGEFLIRGNAGETGLERIVTQPLSKMAVQSGRYGVMCNASGGIVDDLIVFRLAEDEWFLVVNAATTDGDADHIQRLLSPDTPFDDLSSRTGKIDVQGPDSRDLLGPLVPGIEELNYFTFKHCEILGCRAMVSRTGYTGELGYEIFYPWEETERLWSVLIEKGARPAGLGVRDVLRMEMGYSLYGHELTPEITPLEAGLNRFIDWEKDFIGKESLLRQKQAGPARRSIGIVSGSRRSPRAGYPISDSGGHPLGVVTSGTFSPGLNRGIGLGLIGSAPPSGKDQIIIGESPHSFAAEVVRPPFYKQGSLKN